MEAVVLAGGLGMRLRSVVGNEVPKPMADIGGQPFLSYILNYLHNQGIEKVILSIGYKGYVIKDFFGREFLNMKIIYAEEKEPLGTGGAMKMALKIASDNNVFVVNGDTFFYVDLKYILEKHRNSNADITMALKPMENFDRYGCVKITNNRVVGFEEKTKTTYGQINGGIYLMKKSVLNDFFLGKSFSFEKDFLEKYLSNVNIYACIIDEYFIDIGVPEDYKRACFELPKFDYNNF